MDSDDRNQRIYPYVRQQNPTWCGPCCLATVARFFEIDAPSLKHLARSCRTDESGTSLADVDRVARLTLKLTTNLLQVKTTSVLADIPHPCIVPLRNSDDRNHFVVVFARVGESEFSVADPAAGNVTMTLDEIAERWGGELLVLEEPETADEIANADWRSFLSDMYSGCRSKAVRAVGLLLLQALATVVSLLAMRWLFVATVAGVGSLPTVPILAAEAAFVVRALVSQSSLRQLKSVRQALSLDLHQWIVARRPSVKGRKRTVREALQSRREMMTVRESLTSPLFVIADLAVLLVAVLVLRQLKDGLEWLLPMALTGLSLHGWFCEGADDAPTEPPLIQLISDTVVTAGLVLMNWVTPETTSNGKQLLGLMLVLTVVRQPFLRLASVPRNLRRIATFVQIHE